MSFEAKPLQGKVITKLDVIRSTRPGGGGRTERRFLDFTVDGVALSSLFNADFISPFGWLHADEQRASIDRLLRKSPPDVARGRTALYICPECGDLGCGAITLLVESEADVIVWKDFGVQNNYEDAVHIDGFEDIGPFTFDARQYHALFEGIRAPLGAR